MGLDSFVKIERGVVEKETNLHGYYRRALCSQHPKLRFYRDQWVSVQRCSLVARGLASCSITEKNIGYMPFRLMVQAVFVYPMLARELVTIL